MATTLDRSPRFPSSYIPLVRCPNGKIEVRIQGFVLGSFRMWD